jgi:hypothetical protein
VVLLELKLLVYILVDQYLLELLVELQQHKNMMELAWGPGGNLATAKTALAGAGTQTAAVGFGGGSPAGPSASTEEYDGTSWTAGGIYYE